MESFSNVLRLKSGYFVGTRSGQECVNQVIYQLEMFKNILYRKYVLKFFFDGEKYCYANALTGEVIGSLSIQAIPSLQMLNLSVGKIIIASMTNEGLVSLQLFDEFNPNVCVKVVGLDIILAFNSLVFNYNSMKLRRKIKYE